MSEAIAKSARSHGVDIRVESPVKRILVENGTAKGVLLEDGSEIHAETVLSNATPHVTFRELLDEV